MAIRRAPLYGSRTFIAIAILHAAGSRAEVAWSPKNQSDFEDANARRSFPEQHTRLLMLCTRIAESILATRFVACWTIEDDAIAVSGEIEEWKNEITGEPCRGA